MTWCFWKQTFQGKWNLSVTHSTYLWNSVNWPLAATGKSWFCGLDILQNSVLHITIFTNLQGKINNRQLELVQHLNTTQCKHLSCAAFLSNPILILFSLRLDGIQASLAPRHAHAWAITLHNILTLNCSPYDDWCIRLCCMWKLIIYT